MEPLYYVSESKRQIETISYFGDFRDVLSIGETITSQSVTIYVFSGTDTNPSAMLYQGITIHNGNILEQRIRQGIVGNIYTILFSISTSLGNNYDKVTRLAILPNEQGANPVFNVQYETSCLYPYILSESLQTNISVQNGRLALLRVDFEDGITTSIFLGNGSLVYQNFISYSYNEGITTNIQLQKGSLVYQNFIDYSYNEGIQTGIAILTGILTVAIPITYSYNEGITTSISIQNGTLA